MDDLYTAKENEVFVFITNDTDFVPLFERVGKTHQLIWLQGGNNRAKGLEAIAGKARTYDLKEFFITLNPEHPKMPKTHYWDENILKPIYPDIDALRDQYLHDLGDYHYQKELI